MNFKLTKLEKSWILYDVGNSAFILMVSTIIPIYFNHLAETAAISSVDFLAYWGYAMSISTLIVAFAGPLLGTFSDYQNFKKPVFAISILVGAIGCATLGLVHSWILFLIVFIVAKIGFNSSLIFYDSMLTDITTEDRMDKISSHGFAWGYIGSCIPFILSLVLVLGAEKIGLTMEAAMAISLAMIAVWWILASLPLLKKYHQKYYVPVQDRVIYHTFKRLFESLKNIKNEKHIFMFLLAFFFYIDGVYTIIEMATAYGKALGFDSTQLLGALLLTQIVAFPSAILFGRLSDKFNNTRLITVCIIAYFFITIFAMLMNKQIHFWILAVCVGLFQGGVQSLSRSYFAKIIPAEKSGEYFGILDICGKGASFLGTTLIGVISQVTGSVNKGISVLIIIFIIGIILFRKSVAMLPKAK